MLNNIYEISMPGELHVAELAESAGVTPATIRYYSRAGLLHPNRDPHNGYRSFSLGDTKRVKFIRQAQELGLKIAEIKAIVETAEQGDIPCGQVESLVRERLTAIIQQIDELRATKKRIATALEAWKEPRAPTAQGASICPLIEMLQPE